MTFNESITEILEAKITSSQAVAAIRAAIDERIGWDEPNMQLNSSPGYADMQEWLDTRNGLRAELRQAFGITK